jgi:hypothetical protein
MVRDYLRGLMMDEQVLAEDLARLTGRPWYLEYTGGGCTALVLQVGGDLWSHYFMVTHSEDASVPAPDEPHHLGEYRLEDESVADHYFLGREDLITFLLDSPNFVGVCDNCERAQVAADVDLTGRCVRCRDWAIDCSCDEVCATCGDSLNVDGGE